MQSPADKAQALWERLIGFAEQEAGITCVTTNPPSPPIAQVLFDQGFYRSKSEALRSIQQGGVKYRQDDKDVWMIITDKHQGISGLYRIGKHQGMEICKDGTIRAICTKDYPQKIYAESKRTIGSYSLAA